MDAARCPSRPPLRRIPDVTRGYGDASLLEKSPATCALVARHFLAGRGRNLDGTLTFINVLLQIVMDNAVARLTSNAEKLQASGETMGDPIEISRVRREDFYSHEGCAEGDDVVQASNKRSRKVQRGHQGLAAFLMMASGLEKV